MAKIKINRPVVNRGKLHHKIGSVVEVDEKEAKMLIEKGFAEAASKDASVTPGATIDAGRIEQKEPVATPAETETDGKSKAGGKAKERAE